MSESEEKYRRIIEEYGWHVMQVRNAVGESGPTFSYSTGLWKNYGHPEFIVFGQSDELEHLMINIGGDDVKNGTRKFEAGKYYDGFLGGFDVFMIEAGHTARKEHTT